MVMPSFIQAILDVKRYANSPISASMSRSKNQAKIQVKVHYNT